MADDVLGTVVHGACTVGCFAAHLAAEVAKEAVARVGIEVAAHVAVEAVLEAMRSSSRQSIEPPDDGRRYRMLSSDAHGHNGHTTPAIQLTTHSLSADVAAAVGGDGQAAWRVLAASGPGEPDWQIAVATSSLLRCIEEAYEAVSHDWQRVGEGLRLLEEIVSPRPVAYVAVCEEGIRNFVEHHFTSEEEARRRAAQFWYSWVLFRCARSVPLLGMQCPRYHLEELASGGMGMLVGAANTIHRHVQTTLGAHQQWYPSTHDFHESPAASRIPTRYLDMLDKIASEGRRTAGRAVDDGACGASPNRTSWRSHHDADAAALAAPPSDACEEEVASTARERASWLLTALGRRVPVVDGAEVELPFGASPVEASAWRAEREAMVSLGDGTYQPPVLVVAGWHVS